MQPSTFLILVSLQIIAFSKGHYPKMKFSMNNFFSKRDQIRSFLRICSHLLNKSLMENFIFCAEVVLEILIAIICNTSP